MRKVKDKTKCDISTVYAKQPTTRKGKIFQLLREHRGGLTADDISIRLGLMPSQVTGRLSELKKAGIITKTDETRITRCGGRGVVWRYAP